MFLFLSKAVNSCANWIAIIWKSMNLFDNRYGNDSTQNEERLINSKNYTIHPLKFRRNYFLQSPFLI